MSRGHLFWFLLVWACLLWYSTITVFVSFKGILDIRQMLRDLRRREKEPGGGGTGNP